MTKDLNKQFRKAAHKALDQMIDRMDMQNRQMVACPQVIIQNYDKDGQIDQESVAELLEMADSTFQIGNIDD